MLVLGAFHVDALFDYDYGKILFCLYSHWTVYDMIGYYNIEYCISKIHLLSATEIGVI